MDKMLSDKMRVVGFLCTVMVVFRHALNLQAFGIDSMGRSYASFVENGISKVTEIAVPYFFVVSGFFFFRKTFYGKGEYWEMLKKKIRTLFIPFLFWNIVGCIPLLIMHQFVYETHWWMYGQQILNSEWNGVLWYVRDIMTMMLLAPLYSWLFVVNNKWLYFVVTALLFLHWLPVDCGWISSEGIFFFFVGGVLQRYSRMLKCQMPAWLLLFLLSVWIFSSFAYPRFWPIHRYNTLLGLIVFWQLASYVPLRYMPKLVCLSAYSFFIYVVHADLVKAMKVGIAHLAYGNEMVALTSYVVTTLGAILIALGVGKFLNKHIPSFFYIITGGRA